MVCSALFAKDHNLRQKSFSAISFFFLLNMIFVILNEKHAGPNFSFMDVSKIIALNSNTTIFFDILKHRNEAVFCCVQDREVIYSVFPQIWINKSRGCYHKHNLKINKSHVQQW